MYVLSCRLLYVAKPCKMIGLHRNDMNQHLEHVGTLCPLLLVFWDARPDFALIWFVTKAVRLTYV